MTTLWPIHALRPQNVAFDPAPRSLASPASVSGATQVVASDAGIWKATFGNVIIRNRQHVLAFRALGVLLEGRLNPVLVPRCGDYQPKPATGWSEGVPHSDGTPFSDDALYQGTTIGAVAAAAAPARAVTLDVVIANAGLIQAGQDFSVGERMYRIKRADYTAPTRATLKFWPVLREAVPAGAVLNFDSPVCRMRLVDDSQMDLELQLRRFGQPTVQFLEDV